MSKSEEITIRIPGPKTAERVRNTITQDEEFRFDTIKVMREQTKYLVPDPQPDDEDNTKSVKKFRAVVVLAKKNFYQSPEERESGEEKKEKRELFILREGQLIPERFYVSPSAIRNWREILAPLARNGQSYTHVLIEFGVEHIKGKKFSWNKPTFTVVRDLEQEELEWAMDMQGMVQEVAKTYTDDSELADIEDEMLGVEKKTDTDEDDERMMERERKHKRALLNEEDDDDRPAKKKSRNDDDDEEEPKSKKKKRSVEEDEDEEVTTKKSKTKAVEEDDDEEEEKPKKSSKRKAKDEEEDEDLPVGKSKRKSVEEDDDDDLDALVGKKRTSRLADLDDDE